MIKASQHAWSSPCIPLYTIKHIAHGRQTDQCTGRFLPTHPSPRSVSVLRRPGRFTWSCCWTKATCSECSECLILFPARKSGGASSGAGGMSEVAFFEAASGGEHMWKTTGWASASERRHLRYLRCGIMYPPVASDMAFWKISDYIYIYRKHHFSII